MYSEGLGYDAASKFVKVSAYARSFFLFECLSPNFLAYYLFPGFVFCFLFRLDWFLQARRGICRPNWGFMSQLLVWGKAIHRDQQQQQLQHSQQPLPPSIAETEHSAHPGTLLPPPSL